MSMVKNQEGKARILHAKSTKVGNHASRIFILNEITSHEHIEGVKNKYIGLAPGINVLAEEGKPFFSIQGERGKVSDGETAPITGQDGEHPVKVVAGIWELTFTLTVED